MGVVELVLICVAAGFLFRKADSLLSRGSVPPSVSVNGSKGPVATFWAVAWCWLAPTSVMAVFVTLNHGSLPNWERLSVSTVAVHPSSQNSFVIPIQLAEAVEQFPTSDLAGNRPKWMDENDQTSGDIRRVVLTSRLWSTEEEANEELRVRAAALVRSDFERQARHHGLLAWLDPDGDRFISDDRAVELGVKDHKYVERIEQDFGKFKSPMNKVSWQVELSPMVRTELYPAWKRAVVENRIIVIGSVLAILTLLANECALFARLRRDSNGKTTRAALVTAGSVTAWVAAELFVASRLLS